MSLRGLLLALSLLALTWSGCATPVHERPWVEVESAHFELWASLPGPRAVELAAALELLRSVVEVLTRGDIAEPPVPMRVFLVPDTSAYRTLGPRHTAGFFVPSMRAGNIVSLARPGMMSSALRTLQHEYVHWLVENRDAYPYPTWYNEGFAEFLSTVRREGDTVRIGRAPVDRMGSFDAGAWLDLEQLLSAKGFSGWSLADVSTFYSQSWALVHYLNFGQPPGRELRQQMTRYLRLYRRGRSTEEAVAQGFGVPIEELEKELRAYVKAARFTYVDADVSKFVFDPTARAHAVSPPVITSQLGWLFVARAEPDRAQRYFLDALLSDPDHARAHAGLGAVETARQRWEPAEAHLQHALALAPEDPLSSLDLAEHYHERSRSAVEPEERAQLVEQARQRYRRSIELDPDLPEAQAMYGATWSLPGEDETRQGSGLENLERAHRLLPGNVQIKVMLARRRADLGQYEKARRLAIEAQADTHGAAASAELEQLLEEIEASAGP